MTLLQIANGLKATFTGFARSERGNVAMIFAVMLPVLLSSVGAAIDYSRAASARSAMQAAIDATALMVSKEASGMNATQLKDRAWDYFKALYNHPEASVDKSKFNIAYTANSGSGASVNISIEGSMQTDFMKVVNITKMPLNASATTKWGNIRYRVALALDNTGSMASASKMPELKNAATKLVNDFYGMASTNEDVYISIVPFAKDVNIGSSFKNETWLRWTGAADSFEQTAGSCGGLFGSFYKTKAACQAASRTWTAVSQNSWNGCVMDRDKDYDTTAATPGSAVQGSMVWPEQYGACPVRMLGMTSVKQSKQTLLDKINDMAPNGATNQGIGTFWAWMTHQTSGPFPTPSKDPNYVYQDVIILLTDGLNTQNRYDGNGSNHSPEVDARQALLCANAKTAGVKIFAIQVATDNDPVSTVTKNCVSEPNNPNYFSHITQASQMTVKFQNIFKELARLRVAS
jgi:Flp pilus assembly protein TadG